MVQNSSSNHCEEILSNLPFEQGFHFCIDGGKYTGVTATSLNEFTQKLQNIDSTSISFHLKRKDFQRWIQDKFCDEELPRQIEKIRVDDADDEKVRKELVNTINRYIRKYTINPRQSSS
jgi:ABC-type xylose transport system substrate-binding protein